MNTNTRRQRALLAILAVASVVVMLLALLALRESRGTTLIGTDLGGRPAPDFTLTDYRGQTVSLSDLRGKAVALTFIYTTCPDVCPVIARTLQAAYQQLPEDIRDDVALVGITVDPEQDTSEALRAFSELHGLDDIPGWYALRGDPVTLEDVWRAYGIYPGTSPATATTARGAGQTGGTPTASGGGEGHTDAIYLIDSEGRERVLMRSAVDPAILARNLESALD